MSAENVILLPSAWHTETSTVGTTLKEITKPSGAPKNVATVMVQSDKNNTGDIYFASRDDATSTDDYGGYIEPNGSFVLPINLVASNQKLYLISTVASQKYSISYISGGDIC